MKKNLDHSFIRLFLPLLLKAALFSCAGCLFFLFIDQIGGAFIHSEKFDYIDVKFLLFAFLLGSLITLPPVIAGTCFLGFWLYRDFLAQKLAKYPSIFKGILIGGMIGFGICILVWGFLIVISSRAPDFWVFVHRTIIVTLISLSLGGWIGKNWFIILNQKGKSP
jgi:hypothetical protein